MIESPIFLSFLGLFIVNGIITNVEGYVGINWGRMANQRLIPSMAVDMFLQNGIKNVKVYSASANVIEAFKGTDINVTMTIPNADLKNFTSVEDAKKWLLKRVVPYDDVNIRYINVGTQPISTIFNRTDYHVVDVLKYFQIALREYQLINKRGIKTAMTQFTDSLIKVKRPSEGDFKPEIKKAVLDSCRLLNQDNSSIWLDIFPIYDVINLFDNDIEFAYFNNNSTSKFMDGDIQYNNIFEVMVDTFIHALRKGGIYNMSIIAGQAGWPTDGIYGANVQNAKRFNNGFVEHIVSGKGTPLYPGPMDAFVHCMADETKLKTVIGGFTRHWGMYKFDGKPKYNIDFSGQGRDVKQVSGKGITHMPKRWCVFNNETADMDKIKFHFDSACNISDCTSMAPGGSCGDLEFPHNISYAFNMYFQLRSQKVSEEACDFDGLGVIVPNDPSRGTCSFPIEILSAEVFGGEGILFGKGVRKISMESQKILYFLFLLIFFAMI